MIMKKTYSSNSPKIFERNPDTGVVRWRYIGEDIMTYGWPNYGQIVLTEEPPEDANEPE